MAPSQRSVRFATVGSIAALLMLQLCQILLESQLTTRWYPEPDLWWKNATDTNGTETTTPMAMVTSWLYTCRSLLPVLGGLLACRLGHVRVLQLGGGVMVAVTSVQATAIYLDQWTGDPAVTLIAYLLMMAYNGLVMPSVIHGVLSKRTRPKLRTVLCALIYMASVSNMYTGIIVVLIAYNHYNLHVIDLAVNAAVYCAIAFLALPRLEATVAAAEPATEEAEVETAATAGWSCRLQLPTQNRLKRCCLVFGAMVPIWVTLYDYRSSAFTMIPASDSSQGEALFGFQMIVAPVVTIVTIVTATCQTRWSRLPVKPRLILGILLEAALSLVLVVVFIAEPEADIYDIASIVDAVAAQLAIVAIFELLDGFERDGARPLIVGVMLTVWGLANVASRLLVTACRLLPLGPAPQLSVYHAVLLVLLLYSLVYCKCFAFPAADSLTVNYAEEPGEAPRHVQLPVADADDVELRLESQGAGLVRPDRCLGNQVTLR